MATSEFCNREAVIAERTLSGAETAKLMRQYHVGDVGVVESREGRQRPVGIVTDRDVGVELVAAGLSPDPLTAGDIMGQELTVVSETEGVFETIRYMRTKGVRRMPVADKQGWLRGIVTLDDLMEQLAKLVSTERHHETVNRPQAA